MANSKVEQIQKTSNSIWSQLEAWGRTFKPWQRFILANAVRFRQLTDEQVNQAYALFLHDNKLGDTSNPPVEIPPTISGRPDSAPLSSIWLKRIGHLRAINALPPESELIFSPALTVVYGGNGTGKSGFTRILSNVCFSRTRHPILPNVYDEKSKDKPAASIVIADGTQKETEFIFDGSSENLELKRIAVFDSSVARTHLVEQNPLGFKPAGFDVFPEMARVYTQLANRLTAEIEGRNRENTFINSFVAPESTISRFVATLGPDTDIEELRRLAVFNETEIARLEEVQRQITDLQSKSVSDAIKQLEDAKREVGLLQKRLADSSTLLMEEKRTAYRTQLITFAEKARLVATQGSESFKQNFFQGIGTQTWENFLIAAHMLAQVEGENYPRDDDHCLLCHRPLDEKSVALIRRLWGFLASDVRRAAKEAGDQIGKSLKPLQALRLDFFSPNTTVHAHLIRLNSPLARQIETLLSTMERNRTEIIRVLENQVGEIAQASFDDVDGSLSALVNQIDTDITRLREQNIEEALKSLESERITLRHKQVLKQLLPEIEKYVSGLAWAKRASGAPRQSLNPRPLTDKESEFFTTVIVNDYRDRFANECNALDCNLPIEFRTKGQRGQTVRSLSIRGGHSPDEILSEGEQRAIALADFLTEIGLNPANAGIVLDDPVTSQDHQRKDLIANRLVAEAKNRQVVIFTHDLVFLTMLARAADALNVGILTHWMEKDSTGRPGQISLDDCPATTPRYRDTQKAQKTLAEAKTFTGSMRLKLIQRGMAELRRTVEEIIPYHLLKEVVNRWSDRIIVTGLKKVNWNQDLIADIIKTYEDLSAYIEGHSHSEEQIGAPPELRHLEDMITRVNDLKKRAKPERIA